jgi:hypothetical protein
MSDEAWKILINVAATLGPGGATLLLVVLYLVNKERVEKDRMLMQATVAGIKAMNSATKAIDALRAEVKRRNNSRSRRAGGR